MKCIFQIKLSPSLLTLSQRLIGRHIFFIGCLLLFAERTTASEIQAALTVDVSLNAEALPKNIKGTWKGDVSSLGKVVCFYLPYNDSAFSKHPDAARRYDITQQHFSVPGASDGHTTVSKTSGGKVVQINPYLISVSLDSAGGPLELSFESQVPRLAQADDNDWYFDGFYPLMLSQCPSEPNRSDYFQLEPKQSFQTTINYPSSWNLAAPGNRQKPGSYFLRGREYVFGLGKNFKTTTLNVSGVEIEVNFRNPDFLQLLPTIQQAMLSHTYWFGPLPLKRLVILETSDLQRSGQPGIIAFNRPKQSLFKSLEAQWLNWRHWVMANMLATQWYGAFIGTANPDDSWLLVGAADFATLEALESLSVRSNFFNSYESGQQLLVFTYPQMQSLSAAMLRRSVPLATLTDESFTSHPYVDQNPLLFVRHALALRQMMAISGETAFATYFKQLTQKNIGGNITPKSIRSSLSEPTAPFSAEHKTLLTKNLTDWWSSEGWPDIELSKFSSAAKANGKWTAHVEVIQSGELQMPVLICVTDTENNYYFTRVEHPGADGRWIAEIETDFKPVKVEIDPNREIFDAERFNNSSDRTQIKFFPGNAKTLEDDAYTLFWLPYPFRRPGEAVSIGIMASVFRYLNSSLLLRLEGSPSDKKAGFLARKEFHFPGNALNGSLMASQNYEGYRLMEASIDRSPVWRYAAPLSIGVRARHRQIVGQKESPHVTGAAALEVGTGNFIQPCRLTLAAEQEHAPKQLASSKHSYSRSTGTVSGECQSSGGVALFSRAFAGQLLGESPPDLAFFLPQDLKEARIRMDLKGIAGVDKIYSSSNDLFLPFVIPFPGDTLILSRRIKFRTFYDFGRSINDATEYRAGGLGIDLPFGGDLAAVGSFSLTRLSLLSVLYSKAGDEVSRRPRILFDLTGEL